MKTTVTHEEFQSAVAAIPNSELAKMVSAQIHKMCLTGAKSFTMNVPPQIHDTDVILTEMVRRFERLTQVEQETVDLGYATTERKIEGEWVDHNVEATEKVDHVPDVGKMMKEPHPFNTKGGTEYTDNPKLLNEEDLYYTGCGCTWGVDLAGKRYWKRYHPLITDKDFTDKQYSHLSIGDIIEDEARAKEQAIKKATEDTRPFNPKVVEIFNQYLPKEIAPLAIEAHKRSCESKGDYWKGHGHDLRFSLGDAISWATNLELGDFSALHAHTIENTITATPEQLREWFPMAYQNEGGGE